MTDHDTELAREIYNSTQFVAFHKDGVEAIAKALRTLQQAQEKP